MAANRVTLSNATSKGVVFDLIRARGPIGRSELASATGLTQATMTTVVRQLLDDGLIIESGRSVSTGGRPTVLLDLNPDARFALGIQLGAESVTYVVVNVGGSVIGQLRDNGVTGGSGAQIAAQVAEQVRIMLEVAGIDRSAVIGAGVVAPGPLDLVRGTTVGSTRLGDWRDVGLRDQIRDALGLPVVLDNDATAAALGDFWGGEALNSFAHATIYMGSGIGAGILVDGAVFRGSSSNAGEIGELVLDHDANGDPLTLEQLAAPAAVVERAVESAEDAARLKLDTADTFGSFHAIATSAARGDAFAESVLMRSAGYVAEGALCLANLFDLESISLAGPAFAVAGPLYLRVIEHRIDTGFFARANHGITVRLSPNVADAAAIGAAALVLQSELAPRHMGLMPHV